MKTDWTEHWNIHNTLTWRAWTPRMHRAYKKLLKNIKVKNVKILELGSGSGDNSLELAKILNAKEVTLADSNKRALEISKETFKNSDLKVNFLERDVLKLDLKEKFDIVHSEGLIEHFYGKERLAIFKKHIDLCKKGGFVIIFAPYENINYKVFRSFYKKFNKWVWDEEPLTKRELYDLCKLFNLKILNEYSSPLIHEIGVLLKK